MKLKDKKEIVYNLTIADCHEYYVNDILVHNCISLLLASFFIFFGKNLNYYAINRHIFLNEVGAGGIKIDTLEKEKQNDILKEIIDLRKEIKRLSLSSYAEPLERKLKHLESLLDPNVVDITPLSQEQVTKAQTKNKNTNFVNLARMYYK